MGSSASKATSSSSSSGSCRKGRSKGHRGFPSYCLGASSGSRDIDSDDQVCDQNKVNGEDVTYSSGNEIDSDEVKTESFRKVKSDKSDEVPCVPSNIDLEEWGHTASRTGSSSAHSSSNQSLNPSSRFLSRFSLVPGNISFRLSRTTSLGSSRPCPVSSESLSIFNNEDELNLPPGLPGSLINRNETQHRSDLLNASLASQVPIQCHQEASNNLRSNTPTLVSPGNLVSSRTLSSVQDVARDGNGTREVLDVNLFSPRIHTDSENIEPRLTDRRNGAREPVERNVRFSRTLSVGRLRDRVLRRSTVSDFTFCPLQRERDASQDNGRRTGERDTRVSPSGRNAANSSTPRYPLPSTPSSLFGIEDYEVETSQSRETRYQDLLEHRSNFLERRRRIRSQVRALQRLGSRFENLSGHDRSCILSGQHRNGRCACRINSRDTNSNDDTNARASISRIVMLAEALFEVLDEIHQQSMVLSSRPSVSSIGSVPAPNEVVESLPVKLYTKLHKHQEEPVQCYICLVEYEDGDSMRVLPCHHEFHTTCVDKWLKEIHRVCPLCRGDICVSDSLPREN